MAGIVEDAMKQNVKKVKPMTAGPYDQDPNAAGGLMVNNTATSMDTQPGVGMTDGVMANSTITNDQPEGNPEPGAPSNPLTGTNGPPVIPSSQNPAGGPNPLTSGGPVMAPENAPPSTAPAPPTINNDPNGTGSYPGGVIPPGANAPAAPAGAPAGPGTPGWNPATGLVEGVTQGGTVDTTATGYNPAAVGDARGYTAEGYDPTLSGENLSSAIDRIIDKGGALMQRADAKGRAFANKRGLLNSTMAAEASQNAVLDKATEIGAGDVQNAQFNAQQKNEAAEFGANARNRAAEFGAGEANKMMMFAAEQYNIAARFAADAENAARSQNAAAQTDAMQRYNDALNAARAAEYDAENLARRDSAVFQQQTREGDADRQNRIATASIGANASVQTANINAQSRAAEAAADRAMRREEFDINTQIRVDGMGQDAFGRYTDGRNRILTSDMEPGQRDAALRSWDSTWAGNPYLGLDIDLSVYDDPPGTETEED